MLPRVPLCIDSCRGTTGDLDSEALNSFDVILDFGDSHGLHRHSGNYQLEKISPLILWRKR